MAQYTIRTTRQQEIGLKYSYDNYADKDVYKTQADWLQYRVDTQVTNPMWTEQQQANSIAFDQSFNTVPELEQPAARTEIEAVIVAHGGEIVPVGPVGLPPPAPPAPPPPTPEEINATDTSDTATTIIQSVAGPAANPGFPRGAVSALRGTTSNPIQVGGTTQADVSPSGPDGDGDLESETGAGGEK